MLLYMLAGACLVQMAYTASSTTCRVPPSMWCSSLETAKECKVLDQCWEFQWNIEGVKSAPKVNFTLYFESLCPDCQGFIKEQLYPTFQEIGTIMNLTLVPYGNAEETKSSEGKWKFRCQHGPSECEGNILETCSIHILKKINKYFPLIRCMEATHMHSIMDTFKTCAAGLNISTDDILACYNGNLGNQLEHQMAEKTNALNPPHKYVPWVTLNGVHTEKIQKEAERNLKSLLCDAYKGIKPPGCKSRLQRNCLRV